MIKMDFKIGDLVYVEGKPPPHRRRPAVSPNIQLGLILKIHKQADPNEIFYKVYFTEKNREEWISGTYLQPAD